MQVLNLNINGDTLGLSVLANNLFEVENYRVEFPKTKWNLSTYIKELNCDLCNVFYFNDCLLNSGFVLYRKSFDQISIMQIAVRQKGLGFGARLLSRFIDQNLKVDIHLDVDKNNIPAIILYKKLKFKTLSSTSSQFRMSRFCK